MGSRPIPLVAGNWKMNGLQKSLAEVEAICASVAAGEAGSAEVVICPPATLVMAAASACAGSGVAIGGQDCHSEPCGAFTGDLAAEMLKDAGASYVILGHSERRTGHGETSALVAVKARAAHRAGLTAIICVGETLAERQAGEALRVVGEQLAESIPEDLPPGSFVIAYEPVWAIGTGLTPTPADVAKMHGFIRAQIAVRSSWADALRILYGGSVKPGNAAELLAVENVDGALVGGASLVATDFMAIAEVYRQGGAS
jgi:triosephosphate isomerase